MKEKTKSTVWKYEGSIEHINSCALCGSETFISDEIFTNKLGLVAPFDCKQCRRCGLRWLSPRPTQHGYKKIYNNKNYFSGSDAVENYESLLKRRNIKFEKRLEELKSFFAEAENITLLDVGAATGDFVYLARKQGYKADGIELSADARKKSLKKYSIELFRNTLDEISQQGKKYQVIHMNHVFEHFLYPNKILKICFSMLSSDGILIIEVPQQFYNDLDRLKNVLFFFKQPSFSPYSLHHTYFYSPKNLSLMLEKHGFLINSLRTSNITNTPFWFKNLKDFILMVFLFLSDRLHQGGNIIEIISRKKDV